MSKVKPIVQITSLYTPATVEASKLDKLLPRVLVSQYNLIVRPIAEDNIFIYHWKHKFEMFPN